MSHPKLTALRGLMLASLCLFTSVGYGDSLATFEEGVSPTPSLFGLYALNREEEVANYVTEDLLLLSYAMLNNKNQQAIEESRALPLLMSIVDMLKTYFTNVESSDAAFEANSDFISVLHALLNTPENITTAPSLSERAKLEFQEVRSAKGVKKSALWGIKIDYSQFKPRGYYTKTESLRSYFIAYRYASSILFHTQASRATGVRGTLAKRMTRQAFQLVSIVETDSALKEVYLELVALFDDSVGPVDDLGLDDLTSLMPLLFGLDMSEIQTEILEYARENNKTPKIISGLVIKDKVEKGFSESDVLTGWRFLPARYTAESEIFQNMVYPNVGEWRKPKTCNSDCEQPDSAAVIGGKIVKAFPSVAELLGLLKINDGGREGDSYTYASYREAEKVSRNLLGNSHSDNLALLRAGINDGSMQEPENEQRIQTLVATWAWLRRPQNLYAKQSYTPLGKSFTTIEDQRIIAGLQASPAIYEFLLIESRKKIEGPLSKEWSLFVQVLENVIRISAISDSSKYVTGEDSVFLNSVDLKLLDILGEPDTPIVVDVHSVPSVSQAWYVATAVPATRTMSGFENGQALRGAHLTAREFKGPMTDRLTDEQWQEMLRKQSENDEAKQ